MARYDAVFFDSGGTLFDPTARGPSMQDVLDGRVERLVAALRLFGVVTDPSALKQTHDRLHDELAGRLGASFSFYRLLLALVDEIGVDLSAEQAAVVTVCYCGPRYRHWLYPDTERMLSELRDAGLLLGVIANTAWPGFAMETAFAGVGIRKYFQTMVISCDESVAKPDPAIFEIALRRIGLFGRPSRILYVGDSVEKDIRGAKGVGWDAALRRSSAVSSDGLADFEFDESLEVLQQVFGT
jgi:FMN phosphatase YigB (HAD superfamily)